MKIVPEKVIFCRYCGKELFSHQFQCPHCKQWLRSLWPYIISGIVLFLNFHLSFIFLWKLVPAIASALAEKGTRFNIVVRLFIASANFFSNWWLIIAIPAVALGIPLLIYILFFYKPERNYGGYLAITAALLSSLILAIIFMAALYDAAIVIPFLFDRTLTSR